MNRHLERIVCNGPYKTPKGAGMCLRPEFYSGRGMVCMDVTLEQLCTIYRGLHDGEAAGHFPAGAAEAFVQMVRSLPILTGTVFIRNLLRLDAQNYTWTNTIPDGSNVDLGGDSDEASFAAAFGTIMSVFGSGRSEASDKMLTGLLRNQFLLEISQPVSEEECYFEWEDPSGRVRACWNTNGGLR